MNGTLSMTASGVFTYTPNIGYVGGDAFSYRANDGSANSSPAVVNITVNNPFVPTPPTPPTPPVVVTP